MNKTPRALKTQTLNLLHETFNQNLYASKCLQKCFKENKKLGSRDRRFLAETVYEIVRYFRKLLFLVGEDLSTSYSSETLEKVMDSYERGELEEKLDDFLIEESYSDETYKIMLDSWGREKAEGILKSLNENTYVYLRVNFLKTDLKTLQRTLQEEGFETDFVSESSLKLKERKNIFSSESFKKGLFEIQDISSQKVAPFLQVEKGMRVMDACAGAGGKTLHLATLMENKGRILVCDKDEKKLKQLQKRIIRAGVDLVEIREFKKSLFKKNQGKIDRLLLDVPCSGLGVLKRKPDRKWKFTLEELERLKEVQKQILDDYEKVVKVGGKMVYATCSVLLSENQEQIQSFIERHPSWECEEEKTYLPDEVEGDGFYIVRLVKKS